MRPFDFVFRGANLHKILRGFAARLTPDPLQENYFLFHDQNEAVNSIYEVGYKDYVIITCVYTREQYWVYKAISKVKVKYAMILSGCVPDSSQKRV